MAVVPSLKPFLNLRGKSFKYLMRPVPVVLLLLAFWPHSSEQEGTGASVARKITESTAKTATYMIWSSHQGSRKKRRSSSACGRRSYRIFCRRCGSWCDAYRKIGYPWSINNKRGRILVYDELEKKRECRSEKILLLVPNKTKHHGCFPTDQLSPIIYHLQPESEERNKQGGKSLAESFRKQFFVAQHPNFSSRPSQARLSYHFWKG